MEGISNKELVTRGLNKLWKKIEENQQKSFTERLKGASWLWSMRCNDSTELIELLTLSEEEKHMIAQPNIEPTLLHKFHQFYPQYCTMTIIKSSSNLD